MTETQTSIEAALAYAATLDLQLETFGGDGPEQDVARYDALLAVAKALSPRALDFSDPLERELQRIAEAAEEYAEWRYDRTTGPHYAAGLSERVIDEQEYGASCWLRRAEEAVAAQAVAMGAV